MEALRAPISVVEEAIRQRLHYLIRKNARHSLMFIGARIALATSLLYLAKAFLKHAGDVSLGLVYLLGCA